MAGQAYLDSLAIGGNDASLNLSLPVLDGLLQIAHVYESNPRSVGCVNADYTLI